MGRGVLQDFKEAVKWYRLAAEQGDVDAQRDLGFMYSGGQGIPHDFQEAAKWYRLAAEQGDGGGQWNLGIMYDIGRGVPQDDREAVKWYRLATEQRDNSAVFAIGDLERMYAAGRGVTTDEKEVVERYRLAAEQGDATAQCNLGLMYSKGRGVPQDDREAVKWYRLSAEQGGTAGVFAQVTLEQMYAEGQGVPQDDKKGYSPDSIPSGFDEQSYLDDLNNERISLLESISDIIKDYRYGEIDKPTSDHVGRWISQFDKQFQTQILYETNYVLKRTYFSKERITQYFIAQLECLELHGKKPHEFWLGSHILNIQKNGQSQKEIRGLFGKALKSKFGFELDDCGSDGGAYFYLDDALFSGNRIKADLSTWIREEAPEKATVYILTVVSHQGGEYWLGKELAEINRSVGKQLDFHFRNAVCYEDRKSYRNTSEVLWPTEIPDDPLLKAYLAEEQRFPFQARRSGGVLENAIFSTENGRQLLEKEFLLAGMRIRSFSQSPNIMLRPLGFSGFGLGFGSMIVTYRNCPNNTPLALWWGDTNAPSHHPFSKWYPLLPRKTYEEKLTGRKSVL